MSRVYGKWYTVITSHDVIITSHDAQFEHQLQYSYVCVYMCTYD